MLDAHARRKRGALMRRRIFVVTGLLLAMGALAAIQAPVMARSSTVRRRLTV